MDLAGLNRLDRSAAERELLRCCGSTRWARAMAAVRPFADLAGIAAEADKIWRGLGPDDWREAFAAHPRISAPPSGESGAWARQEQAGARTASDAVRDRLASANQQYEARFGHIFIVCATGKTAEDMLAILEHRLTNPPAAELGVAAEEQRKIMQLRIGKLLT